MFSRLRVKKSDVATGVDVEGSERLAIMNAAEKIVPPAHFFTASEVQRQHEVGNLDVVYLIGFRLHCVAHLVPMKHILLGISGMGSRNQQIDLWIPDEFESFVRQGDGPTFSQTLGKFRKDKAEGNTPVISVVVTQSVGDVDIVPKVDYRFAAHVRWLLGLGFRSRLSFQSYGRAQAPVGFEILLDLTIDGAKRVLYLFVAELAVGVVDDRNYHE